MPRPSENGGSRRGLLVSKGWIKAVAVVVSDIGLSKPTKRWTVNRNGRPLRVRRAQAFEINEPAARFTSVAIEVRHFWGLQFFLLQKGSCLRCEAHDTKSCSMGPNQTYGFVDNCLCKELSRVSKAYGFCRTQSTPRALSLVCTPSCPQPVQAMMGISGYNCFKL